MINQIFDTLLNLLSLVNGEDPIQYSERTRKILVFYVLNIHYYLFLIGFLVRYSRHKNLGIINLSESRPRTYKVKILLQAIMGISALAMAYDTDLG